MSYELALLGGPDSLHVQEKILAFKEILIAKLNSYEKSIIEKYFVEKYLISFLKDSILKS